MLDIPTSIWWNLFTGLFVHFLKNQPAHALDTSPAHTCKEALLVASNNRLAILHTATELCDKLHAESKTYVCDIDRNCYATSIRAHHVHAIT